MRGIALRRLKGITNGFTLVELVVGMVVAGIILGIGYKLVEPMFSGFSSARDYSVIYSNAKYALDRIALDIKNAIPNTIRVSPNGTAVEFGEMSDSGYYTPVSGTDNITCAGIIPNKGDKLVIYAVRSEWFYDGDSVYTVNKYDNTSKSCLLDRAVDRGSPYNRVYGLKDIVIYYLRNGIIYRNTVSIYNSDWVSAESSGEPLIKGVRSLRINVLTGHTYLMPGVVINMVVAYGSSKLGFFSTVRLRNVP